MIKSSMNHSSELKLLNTKINILLGMGFILVTAISSIILVIFL